MADTTEQTEKQEQEKSTEQSQPNKKTATIKGD